MGKLKHKKVLKLSILLQEHVIHLVVCPALTHNRYPTLRIRRKTASWLLGQHLIPHFQQYCIQILFTPKLPYCCFLLQFPFHPNICDQLGIATNFILLYFLLKCNSICDKEIALFILYVLIFILNKYYQYRSILLYFVKNHIYPIDPHKINIEI